MHPFVLVLQLSEAAPPPPDLRVEEPPVAEVTPLPSPQRPRDLPSIFGRFQLGLGPPAFSAETAVLRREGYEGSKLWLELDAGYMFARFGRHVGIGAWGGFGRWFSPGNAATPALVEVDILFGIELPVRFGSRDLALLATPRFGLVNGSLSLGGDAPYQRELAWGAQLSGVSSRYHLSASASYLSARVGRPGALGRDHDLGGLYFSVGVLLDDG